MQVLVVVLEKVVVVLGATAVLLVQELVVLVWLEVGGTVLLQLVEVVLVVEVAGCARLGVYVSARIEYLAKGYVSSTKTGFVGNLGRLLAGVDVEGSDLPPDVVEGVLQVVFFSEDWEVSWLEWRKCLSEFLVGYSVARSFRQAPTQCLVLLPGKVDPITVPIHKRREVCLVDRGLSSYGFVDALEAIPVVQHEILFEGFNGPIELNFLFQNFGSFPFGVVFNQQVSSSRSLYPG